MGAALAGVIALGAARAIQNVRNANPNGAPTNNGGGPTIPTTFGSVSSTTPSLPGSTTNNPNQVGVGGPQQTGVNTPVVRAYVLAGDVTDAQTADAKLQQKRKL